MIENFEGDSTVMVFRIQHCYADGSALVEFLHTFFDDPKVAHSPPPASFFGEMRDRLYVQIAALFLVPWLVIKLALQRADESCLHGPKLSGTKSVALLEADFDLEEVKEVKDALGVTINDVMCCVVAGALGKIANGQADIPPRTTAQSGPNGTSSTIKPKSNPHVVKTISASIPINVRPAGSPVLMQNDFSIVRLGLPANESDPIKRVQAFQSMSRALKRSVDPLAMVFAISVLKLFPAFFTS